MRRINYFLISVFSLLLIFSACGGGSKSSSKNNAGTFGFSNGNSGSGSSSGEVTVYADPCAENPGSCPDDPEEDGGSFELPHVTINK